MCTLSYENAVHCERCNEAIKSMSLRKIACIHARFAGVYCLDKDCSTMQVKGGYGKKTTDWKMCVACNEAREGAKLEVQTRVDASLEHLSVFMPKELNIKGHAKRHSLVPAGSVHLKAEYSEGVAAAGKWRNKEDKSESPDILESANKSDDPMDVDTNMPGPSLKINDLGFDFEIDLGA